MLLLLLVAVAACEIAQFNCNDKLLGGTFSFLFACCCCCFFLIPAIQQLLLLLLKWMHLRKEQKRLKVSWFRLERELYGLWDFHGPWEMRMAVSGRRRCFIRLTFFW